MTREELGKLVEVLDDVLRDPINWRERQLALEAAELLGFVAEVTVVEAYQLMISTAEALERKKQEVVNR